MRTAPATPLLLALCAAVLLGACDSANNEDAGTTWLDLDQISGVHEVGGIVFLPSDALGDPLGGEVLVGTDDGIWRLGSMGWARSGLEGLRVRTLRAVPERPGLVLAGAAPGENASEPPFYRSEDGGLTWTAHGEGLFDEANGAYPSIEEVIAKPGTQGAVLYANLMGSSLVRSVDGGVSWEVVKGTLDGFGYPCVLHIPQGDPTTLYQGCEAPLDDAWIRTHDVSSDDQTDLGEGELVVGLDDIANRRPNALASFSSQPGTVYAGLEGALIALEDAGWRWIWRRDDGESPPGYTYVKVVWVDPSDPDHLVFGGGDGPPDDATRAGLYETFDGGETVRAVEGPPGVDFNIGGVRAGTAIGGGRDLLLVLLEESGARVLVRRHPTR